MVAQFGQVAEERKLQLAPLTNDLALFRTPLYSFNFRVIVVTREASIGVDPFSSDEDAHFPETFGEFVLCDENAAR